jgi:hypothetical protein
MPMLFTPPSRSYGCGLYLEPAQKFGCGLSLEPIPELDETRL